MNDEPEMFDKDYVQKLRAEAASYRTQVRDLESQVQDFTKLDAEVKAVRIENELVRRGVEIDPTWVKLRDDQTPSEAVDAFAEKWPNLFNLDQENVEEAKEAPAKGRKVPPPMPPSANKANVPGPQAKGSFGDRTLEEIKKDPVAKSQLTDVYRSLISSSSHLPGE